MKTTNRFFTYTLMILTLAFTSCSKDGTNGTDGVNGEQGIAGIDGTDGNANVSTYLFNEPQWSNGNPSIVLDMKGTYDPGGNKRCYSGLST